MIKYLGYILLLPALFCGAAGTLHAQASDAENLNVVTIGGQRFYVYTVQPGDAFFGLDKRFGVGEADLVAANPHLADGLKAGQVIKVPVVRAPEKPLSARKMSRLFETHVVNQGETAYAISRRYGVSLQTLIEDNPGFDPVRLTIGQKINVRIKSRDEAQPEQIAREISTYTDALNSVSDRFIYHAVVRGETFYSLGRKYEVEADTLKKYNSEELKDGLKAGSILRIPVKPVVDIPPAVSEMGQTGGETGPGSPDNGENRTSGMPFHFRQIDITAPIKVVMLLPLQVEGKADPRFMSFYQGSLLALGELKATGVSVQLDMFNTGRSVTDVESLLHEPVLQHADLIIGPVYDDCFAPAAAFAAANGIPIVSPLGTTSADNPAVFQAAPAAETKTDKLREDFTGDKNIIVITAAANDEEMQKGIEPLLPPSAHRLTHSPARIAAEIERLLTPERENVLVIFSRDLTVTEEILARISSVQSKLAATRTKSFAIKVIGNSRWAAFKDKDISLFFKLNVRYITSYHADRGDRRVMNLDSKYLAEYRSIPSQYAYRGYDVTKMFVGGVKLHGSEFASYINDAEFSLLQIPYRFTQEHAGGAYVNTEWAKVCYNSDYTIAVE